MFYSTAPCVQRVCWSKGAVLRNRRAPPQAPPLRLRRLQLPPRTCVSEQLRWSFLGRKDLTRLDDLTRTETLWALPKRCASCRPLPVKREDPDTPATAHKIHSKLDKQIPSLPTGKWSLQEEIGCHSCLLNQPAASL